MVEALLVIALRGEVDAQVQSLPAHRCNSPCGYGPSKAASRLRVVSGSAFARRVPHHIQALWCNPP